MNHLLISVILFVVGIGGVVLFALTTKQRKRYACKYWGTKDGDECDHWSWLTGVFMMLGGGICGLGFLLFAVT